eukprot:gnl/Dysnectes_brevis/5883_a8746_336.p1 GENE.gnl/Dysnectes_brevis/5883_a8746_336~~gnl/Dysnectes_brevis/5883_a8746_336.p1  ORF type:complete len:450 (+),score=77.66 gnl/Dysnectes_brevis/5883_a8746_336:139-1350(+)
MSVSKFSENIISDMVLPLSVATNFVINGEDRIVPMCTEESSVVAACSNGAKLCRLAGGIQTTSSLPLIDGLVQLLLPSSHTYTQQFIDICLTTNQDHLISILNDRHPSMHARGGGAKSITGSLIPSSSPSFPDQLVITVTADVRDAMGANTINSMCEAIAAPVSALFPGTTVGARILSNASSHRTAEAAVVLRPQHIAAAKKLKDLSEATDLMRRMELVYHFAASCPARCVTHNKGVMNGVSAVALATGNDTRALEAANHALAWCSGTCTPLTRLRLAVDPTGDGEGVELHCTARIRCPVGTVGGLTTAHPRARGALGLLGMRGACDLGEVMAAAGLAQNLAALLALAGTGIQAGHMRLHCSTLASRAPSHLQTRLRDALLAEHAAGRPISETVAARLLAGWQ